MTITWTTSAGRTGSSADRSSGWIEALITVIEGWRQAARCPELDGPAQTVQVDLASTPAGPDGAILSPARRPDGTIDIVESTAFAAQILTVVIDDHSTRAGLPTTGPSGPAETRLPPDTAEALDQALAAQDPDRIASVLQSWLATTRTTDFAAQASEFLRRMTAADLG